MTLTEYANRSVNKFRILVQMDISRLNTQWVNAGAGIWYVNFENLYPEVDSSLLDGFSVQAFRFNEIGSVRSDATDLIMTDSLANLTNAMNAFYYSRTDQELYICLNDYEEPFLHTIFLGAIFGYSEKEFTPVGSNIGYQGRLKGNPSLSISRDPLYFGKIQYTGGDFSLINTDGYFDTFAESTSIFGSGDLYGNQARILFGYEELDISEYIRVFTGTIENIALSENEFKVILADKRKALSKAITYDCFNKNALDAILEILQTHYSAIYNTNYFDTTEWAAAQALVPNITIDMTTHENDQRPVIDIIQDICSSVFGLFIIDAESKYSFKIVDTTASASSTIYAIDIWNNHDISYNPSQVISSAKIGYNKDWAPGYTSPYTFYIDSTYEEAVYLKYKIYNQKQFNTLLITLADATSFATTILDYAKDVHGLGEVTVPMKYYLLDLGDIVDIEINRPVETMLGTKKCEIISKKYNLSKGSITFGYRII